MKTKLFVLKKFTIIPFKKVKMLSSKIFIVYIKMSKDLCTKYYPEKKERLQIFLSEEEKEKK